MRVFSNALVGSLVCCAVTALAATASIGTASAQSIPATDGTTPATGSQAPWRETWVGAEVRAGAWSVYTGTTTAPFGSLDEDGWRLRTVTGYGQYTYDLTRNGITSDHTASTVFADLLVGYGMRFGPTTMSLYAGGAGSARDIAPPDGIDPAEFALVGVKGALETWTELGSGFVLKLDATAAWMESASVDVTQIRVDAMTGWRATDRLVLGIEASSVGDRRLDSHAVGAIAEFVPWADTALTLSGGAAFDDQDVGLYGRIQARMRY